tara:strand:+ start:4784 stop:5176 length:393 start_codon:yes stop_codon:yes gene_type:complete
MEYSDILKIDNIPKVEDKVYKQGWTYFDKKTGQVIDMSSNKTNIINHNNNKKRSSVIEVYKRLSHHWNRYRNMQNELYGDMSPFNNYVEELEKQIKEEQDILEEIQKYNNSNNINNDNNCNTDLEFDWIY